MPVNQLDAIVQQDLHNGLRQTHTIH
jgi:hypothetical protein